MTLNHPPWSSDRWITFSLVPFTLALTWLVAELLAINLDHLRQPVVAILLPLLVATMSFGWIAAQRTGPPARAKLRTVALLVPCQLAPLLVIAPWALVPSHLGVASGGFSFFTSWLTKYPTWGPINHQVLMGMICVLGSSALPVAFAIVRLRPPASKRQVLTSLLALQLIAYLPVLIKLDIDLLWYAMVLLDPEVPALSSLPFAERLASAAALSTGPIGRFAAGVCMVLALTPSRLEEPPRVTSA